MIEGHNHFQMFGRLFSSFKFLSNNNSNNMVEIVMPFFFKGERAKNYNVHIFFHRCPSWCDRVLLNKSMYERVEVSRLVNSLRILI